MKGVHIMKKRKNIRVFVIVFSLLILFALPCISFATSFSDIRPMNADKISDNHLNMRLDSHGSNLSDYTRSSDYARKDYWWRPHDRGIHGLKHHQPTATPIPTAVWLLGTGLVGLVGIKRKLRK